MKTCNGARHRCKNEMSKRPLFFVFLALCIGIWACNLFHIPKIPGCRFFGIPFLFEKVYPAHHIKNFTPKYPEAACVAAIIVTEPVSQKTTYNRTKTTFTAQALTLARQGGETEAIDISGLMNAASFDSRDVNLEYGDYVLIKGSLGEPGGFNNPGCFNYREYLARQGIHSAISVRKGGFIAVLGKEKASRFLKYIFKFKRKLTSIIKRHLPPREGSVLIGILLGDRSGIGEDLKDRFIKTGTVHILAISGLHAGLIASIFILALRFLCLPRRIVHLVTSILLILYAFLTGANVPVVRATIMAIAVLIGTAFGRKADLLNCLGLAGIIILLKNSSVLFDAGFQLSFATVISIIIFAPKLENILKFDHKENLLKKFLKRSIAVSLAAWIGIIPIIAYHFNIVSPVCIIANIAVVFLLSLVVAAGLAFLGIALLVPFLASVFGLSVEFLISVLIKTVTMFSHIPFGFFWTHKWNGPEALFFYIAAGLFGISLYRKNFSKYYAAMAMLVFLNLLVWLDVLPVIRHRQDDAGGGNQPVFLAREQLRITVLDVGHGDAIVIQFPGGGCALIDAGRAAGDMDIGEDVIGPYLRSQRISAIDALFITHPDSDHIGGVPAVLKNFRVSNIFDNRALKRPDRIVGFKDVEILVLNPPAWRFSEPHSDNNNSLVLKMAYGRHSFLFCADIEQEAMEDLLAHQPYLKADFIKIPHHGALAGPAEEAFINAVSPKIALISSDSNDASDSLLRALSGINCRAYETYRHGAIEVRADKERFCVETYN